MELTRRDALAALAVGGGAVAAGATVLQDRAGEDTEQVPGESGTPTPGAATPGDETLTPDAGLGAHERETLLAVADVVYPSEVSGVEEFVTTYLDGRAGRQSYALGATEAIDRLDEMGQDWHGGRFVDLDPEARERLLREAGTDTAEADPEGSPTERIRYYLVNELLYGLYRSPTGGKLVGIENPQGHPGGIESYQRGPSV